MPNPYDLEDEVPPWVLNQWEAHYALRPWGGAVDDERLAYGLMNLVQALTGGKSRKPGKPDPDRIPWQLADFLITRLPAEPRQRKRRTAPERPMTPEETVRYLAGIFRVPASART